MNMSAANPRRYEIRPFTGRVNRQMRRLPPEYRPRVDAAINALSLDPRPRGAVQLYDNIYRIRVGRYRVVYHIDDSASEIDVGKIGPRDESMYQNLRSLFRT